MRDCLQANSLVRQAFFLCLNSLSGWVCQWKPFWIHVGESFQKAHLEEWKNTGDDSSDEQGTANFRTLVQGQGNKDFTSKQKLPEEAPPSTKISGAA